MGDRHLLQGKLVHDLSDNTSVQEDLSMTENIMLGAPLAVAVTRSSALWQHKTPSGDERKRSFIIGLEGCSTGRPALGDLQFSCLQSWAVSAGLLATKHRPQFT
jgi:hypothetical protein